jgi:alpha-1,2-mannosyltransferase
VTKKIAIVAGLAVVTAFIVYLAWTRNGFFDSKVYYGAVQYWFRDHGMIYDWLRPGTPYGFTYPPFAALVMAPMAVLPFGLVLVLAGVATTVTTGLLMWWFIQPLIRRTGWTPWYAWAIATCLALAFEPVRETFTFGQVNTLLLTLVAGDLLFGVARGRAWGGVGIGLATAVKLTPGVFILYLLVTRRFKAAFTAIGTAAGVTSLAAIVAPDQSREFWTSALWDTGRVGVLSYLSNQSYRGFLARLPVDPVASYLWIAGVLVALGFWAWRVRRTDEFGGLALTGILGCLISPVTWIHHCVWLLPAIVRCVDAGLSAGKRGPLWLGGSAYLLMTSRLTWLWEKGPRPPLAIVGGNLYFWFSLALFAWMPAEDPAPDASRSSDLHDEVAVDP